MFGSRNYVAIYLASGFVGNLASLLWHKNNSESLGASGGINGIVGAYWTRMFRRKQVEPEIVVENIAKSFVPDLVMAVTDGQTNINYVAHLGGLVTGCLLDNVI